MDFIKDGFKLRVKNFSDEHKTLILFDGGQLPVGLRVGFTEGTASYPEISHFIRSIGFSGYVISISDPALLPLKYINEQGIEYSFLSAVFENACSNERNVWHQERIHFGLHQFIRLTIPPQKSFTIVFDKDPMPMF